MGDFIRRRMILQDKKELVHPPYVSFTSPSSFTLSIIGTAHMWDGTIEYSTDGEQWNEWNGSTTLSSGQLDGDNVLLIRGSGNTIITGSSAGTDNGAWHFNGSNISIAGESKNFLNYQGTPTAGAYAFKNLFGWKSPGNTAIVSAANFYISDPLSEEICNGMFSRCKGLIYPPRIAARTMVTQAFHSIFYECSALSVLPILPVLTLAPNCYDTMFNICTSIKVSLTYSEEYPNEYRIPISGTGVNATNATYGMFAKTGGSYKPGSSNAPINTIIYTANDIAY